MFKNTIEDLKQKVLVDRKGLGKKAYTQGNLNGSKQILERESKQISKQNMPYTLKSDKTAIYMERIFNEKRIP